MDKKIVFFIILAAIFLILGYANRSTNNEEAPPVLKEQEEKMIQENEPPKPPEMKIDTSKTYQAVLSTTEGVITINLYADKTPITVNNFVNLSQKGFYDKTVFHRVMKDFMIQGGDPKGNGTGGPGYRFDDESFEGEYKRGIVAMANAGPNTNGSQFFIMHKDYNLPKNYVIFGKVIQGIDVVDKIADAPVEQSVSGENSKPVNPVVVESVKILIE